MAAAAATLTVGVFQLLQGIAALAEDEFFVQGVEYSYKFDLTTWGWIHVVNGVVLVSVGASHSSAQPGPAGQAS